MHPSGKDLDRHVRVQKAEAPVLGHKGGEGVAQLWQGARAGAGVQGEAEGLALDQSARMARGEPRRQLEPAVGAARSGGGLGRAIGPAAEFGSVAAGSGQAKRREPAIEIRDRPPREERRRPACRLREIAEQSRQPKRHDDRVRARRDLDKRAVEIEKHSDPPRNPAWRNRNDT